MQESQVATPQLSQTLQSRHVSMISVGGMIGAALVKAGGGQNGQAAGDLQNARVVSLKSELGIAVLSIGAKDGVKPGMPFEIYREDKPIAKVLVTEVRNSVCGAVVQELATANDPVRVGDRGRVDLNKTL